MGKHRLSTSGWPSLWDNSKVLSNYYYRLKLLAISAIKWEGLPPEIDERFLELTLFDKGMSLFFRDEIAERYVALTTAIGGDLTIYNVPTWRRAYAPNGYNYQANTTDSVIIFNNYLRLPEIEQTQIFAQRLYEIQRAIDVNIKGQKYPILVKGTESQRLTLLNLYKQYDGNEPFIFGTDQLNMDCLQAINTSSPYVADKLEDLKKQVWTEALTYYGIDNQTQKMERLVSLEAIANLGLVEAQRDIRLQARKQACRQINDMFGLQLDVRYRYNYTMQMALEFQQNAEKDNFIISHEGGDVGE